MSENTEFAYVNRNHPASYSRETLLASLEKRAKESGFVEPKLSVWVRYMADEERGRRDLAMILEFTRIAPAQRQACLDVGCGYGNLLEAMEAKFLQVAGLEIEPDRVELCGLRCPRADVREGSIERLPWADNVFDLVTSTDVFEHIDYATQVKAARELFRVCKPGGWAFITVPNRFQLYDEHNFYWFGTWMPDPVRRFLSLSLRQSYVKTWERAGPGWAKVLSDAGFRVTKQRVGSRRYITANRFNYFCQK